ncbi:amidohydrolase family protein [Curtobacterium sp. MWU13-2055]|uniref:amidohydrolase family protein n=1 Tax=Curtobacterium sp. MWU13-2055 TaxID=2931928 RepID=UPI00200C2312|nr:amidohydrolase family protein [Curtobacterium sp. MWU13-2055]
MDLILRTARLTDGRLVDVHVADGTIVRVAEAGTEVAEAGTEVAEAGTEVEPTEAARVVDCAGRVVIPGLIESHLHVDKALLDRERPNPDGTLAGAIAVTGELKRGFTHDSVRDRARTLLDQAIANGTTLVRAHPDVDPVVGLTGVEVLLALRDEYRDALDLQIVAFPQEGIAKAPGTLALLRQALAAGADVIGGCTYNEATLAACHEHIETVLDLAEEFDVPADLHADFADDTSDPRFALAGHIADRVAARGLRDRVALGHVTSLASLPPVSRSAVLAKLAAAGVAVVPLPATDLHLGGRSDDRDVRRGVVPVRELWDAGVTSAYSSNNVRNAFTPFGNADLLDIGLLLAQVGHLSGPADLGRVLEMATSSAARVVGVSETHGIRPGAAADLVVLSTTDPAGVLLDRPDRNLVVKRGRVVAETTRTTRLTTGSTTRSKELTHA